MQMQTRCIAGKALKNKALNRFSPERCASPRRLIFWINDSKLHFGDFEPVAGLQEIQPADDGQGGVPGILFGSSDLGIGENIGPVECDAEAELSAGAVDHQNSPRCLRR
jgi:hypothetical protein